MSLSAIIPPYRPDHPDWVSRDVAAKRLYCSPRDIPNRVAKGTLIAHEISKTKKRYYAPPQLYEQGVPVLPIETYDDERCFIVWITFSDDSRKEMMKFDGWNNAMFRMIDDYVTKTIRKEILDSTFRLKSDREHHDVSIQDPIMHFVIKMPGQKIRNLNDRS